MSDLNRQLSFCKKAKMRVLGVVENMSGIECIECGHINDVFGTGAVELFSTKNSLVFLGRINFSIKMCRELDSGQIEHDENIAQICSGIRKAMNF
ncbi:NUBP2 [Enterospora canceri]|uniref:NUBP2 n=1 Tax=Enterospora canceri TaxID=1081671 RepID=A0A1Y1S4G9_9MICR|nr:NUBP2 [Enterospora canceri]